MFRRIIDGLGLNSQIPVLVEDVSIPKNGVFTNRAELSEKEIRALQGKMISQQQTIQRYHEAFELQRQESVKTSRLIAVVSLSVGFLIGGASLAVYGQKDPEGKTQEISSLIAKLFSEDKTGFELIADAKQKDLKIKSLQNALDLNLKIIDTQKDIIDLTKLQVGYLTEKNNVCIIQNEMLVEKACENKPKKDKKEVISKENQETKHKKVDNSKTYENLSKNISELNNSFSQDFKIKFQQNVGGRMLVWAELNGQKSLGFFADSEKYQDRLSKENLNSWALNELENLKLIEEIKNIASSKNIGLKDKNFPISIDIKQQYSGEIKVIITDNFTKKTTKFLCNSKNDNTSTIKSKLEKSINEIII